MKRRLLMAMVSIFVLGGLFAVGAYAGHDSHWGRRIDPIVSTDWLSAHSAEVVIIDIRSAGDYATSHISNSINEPFVNPFDTKWVVSEFEGLWLELPKTEDLFQTIGDLGITRESLVVIVTAPNPGEPPFYGLCNATRVADTLIYAGVKNVAVLDGGYPKWVAEGKHTDSVVPNVIPVTYRSRVNEAMFVPIEYVRKHIGKAVIIDARDAEVYFGAAIELPFAPKAGHIPSAASLPGPWVWNLNSDGTYTYKETETLRAMAKGVIGRSKNKEIIVYCGVGGYASTWWFVLTQVLGYENVKFYDGAAQEWINLGYDMVPYQWD